MSWLSAFFMLLKYLPDIVAALQRGEDFIELRIQLGKVDNASTQAKTAKDTSGLEKLLNPSADSGRDSPPKP